MKKHIKYHDKEDLFESENEREKESNTTCDCGHSLFFVNYIKSPHAGNYIKLTCALCETKEVLHDDFA